MVWLIPGVVLYAVVGLVGIFAFCLSASAGDRAGERVAARHAHPAAKPGGRAGSDT
jgi:hypothetical protein